MLNPPQYKRINTSLPNIKDAQSTPKKHHSISIHLLRRQIKRKRSGALPPETSTITHEEYEAVKPPRKPPIHHDNQVPNEVGSNSADKSLRSQSTPGHRSSQPNHYPLINCHRAYTAL
eukprot:155661_1